MREDMEKIDDIMWCYIPQTNFFFEVGVNLAIVFTLPEEQIAS